MQPRDADPITGAKPGDPVAYLIDGSHHLVPRDHWRFARLELPFHHVQVRATDTARSHAHPYLVARGLRVWGITQRERIGFNR